LKVRCCIGDGGGRPLWAGGPPRGAGCLKAPLQHEDCTFEARDRGSPQGPAISPLLANIFLHSALDGRDASGTASSGPDRSKDARAEDLHAAAAIRRPDRSDSLSNQDRPCLAVSVAVQHRRVRSHASG
jgi:hypothetical protein